MQQHHFQVKQKNSRDGDSTAVVGALEMCLEGVPSWEICFHLGHFSGVCYQTTSKNGSRREQNPTYVIWPRPECSWWEAVLQRDWIPPKCEKGG